MDVEVFIHGTPMGNCFYGKADESNYFGTMYNGEKENYLLVKIRKAGDNKIYCYYNYLIYQNVIGKSGRPGSFFGITLRLDTYCMDIQNMYRILDTIFNSYVKGELLESVGGNLRYLVDNFNDTLKLEPIKKSVIDLFLQTFKGKESTSFTPIDYTFTLTGNGMYTINLYDYPDENIFRFIKETGQIRISPYFPTQETNRIKQQYDKHLEEIRQQHESERKSDLEEKGKLNSFLSESKNKEKSLLVEIEQKKKELRQVEDKLKSIERAKEIEYLVKQIKIPIENLSNYIGHTAPVVMDKITRKGRKWYFRLFEVIRKGVPFVNLFLLVLVLFCVGGKSLSFLPFGKMNQPGGETKQLMEEISSLKDEKSELEKLLKTSRIPKKGITIDIADYKESVSLVKGKEYKMRSVLDKTIFKWEVDGAKIKEEKDGACRMTICGDTIRIRFLMNGKTVAERIIP